MHDGSLTTLENVIDFYNEGGRPNPNLSPLIRPLFLDDYEKEALVAFLRTLTDQQYEYKASESPSNADHKNQFQADPTPSPPLLPAVK
jgi:cytochrome c peroxidase